MGLEVKALRFQELCLLKLNSRDVIGSLPISNYLYPHSLDLMNKDLVKVCGETFSDLLRYSYKLKGVYNY